MEGLQKNILNDIVSQASLVPNLADKYRCMVLWDTRTNTDVRWLMINKEEEITVDWAVDAKIRGNHL